MMTTKKFVINRENKRYIYVEVLKNNSFENTYVIYHNINEIERKTEDDFYATYGTDSFLTLYEAMCSMDDDIIEISNNMICILLNNIKMLKERLKTCSDTNPSLWGYKQTLLFSIDSYNNILNSRKEENEYDYERDFNRIEGNDIEDLLERIRN